VIENLMLDIMYKTPSMKGVKECVINKDVVKNKAEPALVMNKIKKGA